jgi:hypothetical protein
MVCHSPHYPDLSPDSLLAHQTFKLGYDVILKQLANPPTNDLQNFLGYCEAWATSIEHHHNSEVCWYCEIHPHERALTAVHF